MVQYTIFRLNQYLIIYSECALCGFPGEAPGTPKAQHLEINRAVTTSYVPAFRAGGSSRSSIMSDAGASRRFDELSADDQSRYREFGRQMVRLAGECAVPIIFAPSPGSEGNINSATGAVLKLDRGYFIVTAHHVLDGYRKRLQSGEKLNWQVGHLPPFDPLSRIADAAKDTLLLSLSADEARQLGARAHITAPTRWPPPTPKVDQIVLVAGYLKLLREVIVTDAVVRMDGLNAMFRVTCVGDGYFYCKYEREEDLVSFNGLTLPDMGMSMGGLSGGPAFLVVGGSIIYPALVGVISECVEGFGLLRIATLENAVISTCVA
jgi:hypothetical protein